MLLTVSLEEVGGVGKFFGAASAWDVGVRFSSVWEMIADDVALSLKKTLPMFTTVRMRVTRLVSRSSSMSISRFSAEAVISQPVSVSVSSVTVMSMCLSVRSALARTFATEWLKVL